MLTTSRPAEVRFLAAPPAVTTITLRDAIELSGPEDAKEIDAHQALERKYLTCFGSYMEKNDPTWGRNVDLYVVSYRGGKISGVANYSTQLAAKADGQCGAKRVGGSEDALKKLLDKRRDARRAAQFVAVKKRFGG